MTRKIKTTTGWLAIAMPQQLSDITLGQLIAMQSADELSDLDAISILSGRPLADLQNIVDVRDLEIFNGEVLSIAHQIRNLYDSDAIPQRVTFTANGRLVEVKVINDLAMEPAGAYYASRELIADAIAKHIAQYGEDDWQDTFSPPLTVCAQILAQYFFCRATGKPYNEAAATEFEDQIRLFADHRHAAALQVFFFELSKLIEAENRLLASPPSAVEQRAGIKDLEPFKYINTVNALASGDITKWDIILNLPYHTVLTKLLLNKTEAAYQKRYGELMRGSQ